MPKAQSLLLNKERGEIMNRNFIEIKKAMLDKGITAIELAEKMTPKRSSSYMTARFQGKRAWDLDDVYSISNVLDISLDQFMFYFPDKRKER